MPVHAFRASPDVPKVQKQLLSANFAPNISTLTSFNRPSVSSASLALTLKAQNQQVAQTVVLANLVCLTFVKDVRKDGNVGIKIKT